MDDINKDALRALAEKATPGAASCMTSAQIGEATAARVALRDAMHPVAVLALLDEVARLREAGNAMERAIERLLCRDVISRNGASSEAAELWRAALEQST